VLLLDKMDPIGLNAKRRNDIFDFQGAEDSF